MKVVLDEMNRFVVPEDLRDPLSLKPGDELEATLESGSICLRPVAPGSPLSEEAGILVCTSALDSISWDAHAFIEEQRTERSRQLGGL